jgi:predicted alpha-1,2-mannosidase
MLSGMLSMVLVVAFAAVACKGDDGVPDSDIHAIDALDDLPGDASGDPGQPDNGEDATHIDDTLADANDHGPDFHEPPLPTVPEHVAIVDPFIGSGGYGWWAGNVSVGAQAPFGMVQAGPDTTAEISLPWEHCSGYHADDDRIRAFSHAHLHGTGVTDMGAVGFMPFRGTLDAGRLSAGLESGFDKASEASRPGYYAATLTDHQVRVELTATEVAAVHRYSFPDGVEPGVLTLAMDLSHTILPGSIADSSVEILDGGREVRIYAHNYGEFTRYSGGLKFFLVVRPDRAPTAWGTWKAGVPAPGVERQDGQRLGAWLEFDASDGRPMEVRVGLSYVDLDGAAGNLDDLPEGGFVDTLERTQNAWEARLSRLRCDGGTVERRRILATALYHSLMMSTRFMDLDGRYRGLDREVHDADFVYHSGFSLWDTYRGLHSLVLLIDPARQTDLARTLVRMARDGGYLPKWPLGANYTNIMIGSPADMVLAETWLKGLRDFDIAAAYASMRLTAGEPPPEDHAYQGRVGIEDYVALGYVPVDKWTQSVARTLEFAIADASIANLAEALGLDEDAALFRDRAGNWRNLWNADAGLFVPRRADGSWLEGIDETTKGLPNNPYTEGSPIQYLWLVPHDPAGLVDLLGGAEILAARLEDFFLEGRREHEETFAEERDRLWWIGNHPDHYWHGNEPGQHAAYLFNAAGRPDLAGQWLRWVTDTLYTDKRDGVPGNEDAGTLSSWYVWAVLGLFPMPGSDRYWLGSPRFERCEVDLGDGKTLVVEAPGAEVSSAVNGVSWNGASVEGLTISHGDLAAGGTLVFMTDGSAR